MHGDFHKLMDTKTELRRKGVLERETKAIMDMYTNIETSVKVEYTRLELFDVKVGVHQGSILSPLLFALVMDEVTKDIREGVVKEMLYADDVVLVGDNWEEVESRYTRWKKALQEKGMKINVNKTKAFYTRKNFVRTQMRKYPYSVCSKEWEGTPCSVQNANTGCTRGVLEFMEV